MSEDPCSHVKPGTPSLASPFELSALVLYADAAAQTGDADASTILYERIEPFADQIEWNAATTWGHARMYLGCSPQSWANTSKPISTWRSRASSRKRTAC